MAWSAEHVLRPGGFSQSRESAGFFDSPEGAVDKQGDPMQGCIWLLLLAVPLWIAVAVALVRCGS